MWIFELKRNVSVRRQRRKSLSWTWCLLDSELALFGSAAPWRRSSEWEKVIRGRRIFDNSEDVYAFLRIVIVKNTGSRGYCLWTLKLFKNDLTLFPLFLRIKTVFSDIGLQILCRNFHLFRRKSMSWYLLALGIFSWSIWPILMPDL